MNALEKEYLCNRYPFSDMCATLNANDKVKCYFEYESNDRIKLE